MVHETLVIGIGSPQGDDRVGWVVLEQLADRADVRAAGDRVSLELLDRPGATLIGRWQGAHKVVMIDAVRSGAPPGTLHRISADDIVDDDRLTSSHGFGVAEAIRLAQSLGALPEELVVLGIEAGSAASIGESLSPQIVQALPRFVDAVAREIASGADLRHTGETTSDVLPRR